MKQVLTTCLLLLLFTACQQQNAQSPTAPGSGTGETSRVKYRVVVAQINDIDGSNHGAYLHDFEIAVNQAIAEGWQPIGGVSSAMMGGLPMQAMVKTE